MMETYEAVARYGTAAQRSTVNATVSASIFTCGNEYFFPFGRKVKNEVSWP